MCPAAAIIPSSNFFFNNGAPAYAAIATKKPKKSSYKGSPPKTDARIPNYTKTAFKKGQKSAFAGRSGLKQSPCGEWDVSLWKSQKLPRCIPQTTAKGQILSNGSPTGNSTRKLDVCGQKSPNYVRQCRVTQISRRTPKSPVKEALLPLPGPVRLIPSSPLQDVDLRDVVPNGRTFKCKSVEKEKKMDPFDENGRFDIAKWVENYANGIFYQG